MKFSIPFIITVLVVLSSCGEKLTEKVLSIHPTNTPSLIEYYKQVDSVEVLAKVTRFYFNGEKQEETFMNGKSKEGTRTLWYLSGDKQEESNYKDNVKHGIYRVKLNNDNKFCICTSEGFLKNDQRRHLVFTCSADGTRRLYGDGVEIEGAWEQGEKYVVLSKVRNVKIGQEGSDWIQFSTFKIYSNELSAETVANLPKV